MNPENVSGGGYSTVAVFLVIGIVFVVATLLMSYAARRRGRPSDEARKTTTYECGEQPVGDAHNQLHVGYYIFALIFVVFDIETVFLAPWAATYVHLPQGLRMFAFIEMMFFLAILVVGLAYAWKKGVLRWI
jgi:NADH-quinone oxidoreductase subunit A